MNKIVSVELDSPGPDTVDKTRQRNQDLWVFLNFHTSGNSDSAEAGVGAGGGRRGGAGVGAGGVDDEEE